jgi:uncharacterized membrane protein
MKNLTLTSLVFFLMACSNSTVETIESDSTTTILITDSISGSAANDNRLEQLLQQKRNAGLEFYGIGQEPGWSLEMDMESKFGFKSYDGVEMNTPPVAGVNEGGATVYRMQVEMGEMIITLAEMECLDVMSGQKFPYQVRVSIKRGIDSSFREYLGCGAMLK